VAKRCRDAGKRACGRLKYFQTETRKAGLD
jgi:hypothetical protein